MRKVIGIGETVYDIIFKDGQPIGAVPGGSVFNGIISLGRAGVNATFISETGDDRVGHGIVNFLKENNVNADNVNIVQGSESPISLAFLDENNDAEYIFYKDHSNDRGEFVCPQVDKDDIIMFGSYYSINSVIRPQVESFLKYAKSRGAILYYDVNYRAAHGHEVIKLMPNILENFEYADILRGSRDDFKIIFNLTDPEKIYHNRVAFYTKNFICTAGSEAVELKANGNISKSYPTKKIATVSTIGAGDNFNAGVVFGLIRYGITKHMLETGLNISLWDKVIDCAYSFSLNVCQSLNNYISNDFAETLKEKK